MVKREIACLMSFYMSKDKEIKTEILLVINKELTETLIQFAAFFYVIKYYILVHHIERDVG